MHRRSFTKAMASLLVVPLLKFQPQVIDRHKLLSMFLEEDCYSRFDLTRPYVVGDFSYGTDGRAMARIDTNKSEHEDETIKMPPIQKAWDTHYQPSQDWRSFKLAEYDQLVLSQDDMWWGGSCPMCDDRRVSFGENYPTDQTTADELPDYDPDDNTIRDVSCELCHGKRYRGGSHQVIGGQLIAYRYAKKLAAIPGCEICASDLKHGNSHVSMKTQNVLFRSDIGISGIVLPAADRRA
jgi:hypothetical protein